MDVPAAAGGGEQQKVTPFCELASKVVAGCPILR
jgi:hypothetical protein